MWIDIYTCRPTNPYLVPEIERKWFQYYKDYFNWMNKNYPDWSKIPELKKAARLVQLHLTGSNPRKEETWYE